MPAPRERLIRKLSRIQAFGERALFFVEEARPLPAGLDTEQSVLAEAGEVGESAARPPDAHAALETPVAERELERRWRGVEARVKVCTLCRLCESRTHAVFGSGTRRTRLFIIGEGPGEQEDRQAEAFVGLAGQLLTKILKAIGFERDQVFITNVVKCRPPRNRTPLPDEIAACAPYLEAQLEMVRPVVILTLGACATQTLLGITVPISKLRGRVHLYRGIPLVPTYHPAALLRNPEYKRPTWDDVQLLRRVYDEGMARLEAGEPPAMDSIRPPVPEDGGTSRPEAGSSSQLEMGA
jgi:DNA polymerase